MLCKSGSRNWKPPRSDWWTWSGAGGANAAKTLPVNSPWASLPSRWQPPSPEQQEVIAAQALADEAFDRELLQRLEARRKARREKRARSESFPAHLPRRVRIIDLPEEEKAGLKLLGIKVTERLRFEKPTIYVEEIHRYEYVTAGRPEEGVKSAPAPLAIIEGCKYDFSVIAAMLAMKLAFHIPTYRQQDWFAQSGWFPSRSTVNDLFNYSVDTIVPLYGQMWHSLLGQPILLGDDTRLRVLLRNALSAEELAQLAQRSSQVPVLDTGPPADTGPPGSATSYAWLYTGLDGGAEYNVFHWSLTHENSVIDSHLATFRGIFVGDACGANARLAQRSGGRIEHASCNAHARREFVAAESSEPVLAAQAESLYRQLYEVEERGKTLTPDERWALRQRDAVPIWSRIRQWLDSVPVQRVLPKSALGKAVGYLRNQWSALQVYLRDGRLPIDNDQSEQTIRPLTVGRSNWLFLGHPRGGRPLAVVQHREQRPSSSLGDSGLLGGRVTAAGRCAAEPSFRPRTGSTVPAGSSPGPLGPGPSSVRASRTHRGEGTRLGREARTPGESANASPRGRSDRRSVSSRLFAARSFCDIIEGMTHDDQPDLQQAQAQLDRAVDDLLTTTQALARQQQTFALLQRMSPEVAQRIGRSLFDQMLAAEGDRAAEEATREFPEYLQEVMKCRGQRGKPS